MAHLPTSTVTICWCYPTATLWGFLFLNKWFNVNVDLFWPHIVTTRKHNWPLTYSTCSICIVPCFLFSEMTCHAPLKCWAACQVDIQTLSTATIISFFFFFPCPWGSVEQKLSEYKQNRGWCCCHGLAVNAPGLTAGARRKGTEENTETERRGQKMKQKIVNSVTLLDRTVFCALCKLTWRLPTNRAEAFGQRALKRSQSSSELEDLSFNHSRSAQH